MPTGTMLPDLRAVLFDVDGTLIDSLPGVLIAIGETAEAFLGVRPQEAEIRALIGVPLTGQFRIFGAPDDQIDAMVESCIARIEELAHLETNFDLAAETLALAHERGLRTALVTSKSRPEVVPFLERFSHAGHVQTVVSASDVIHPKPNPEAARLACERLGVEPHQAAMIGDSVYDLRCARGAGVMAVAVAYGAGAREALAAEEPDLLFDTPEALLDWAHTALPTLTCPARS
jgi:HAD superfamily hydrolase (TIGR01549 family)